MISSLEEKLEPNTRVLLCVPRVSHGSGALTSYRSGQSAVRVAPPPRLTRTILVTGIDPFEIGAKTGPPTPETGPVQTGAPGVGIVPVGTGATGIATARPVSRSLGTTEAPDPRRPPPEGSNEARLAAPTRQPRPSSKKKRRRLRSRLLRQPRRAEPRGIPRIRENLRSARTGQRSRPARRPTRSSRRRPRRRPKRSS